MENTNKLQIGDKVSLKGYRNRLFGTVEEIIESPYADYALLVRTKPIKSIKTNGGYHWNSINDLVIYRTFRNRS